MAKKINRKTKATIIGSIISGVLGYSAGTTLGCCYGYARKQMVAEGKKTVLSDFCYLCSASALAYGMNKLGNKIINAFVKEAEAADVKEKDDFCSSPFVEECDTGHAVGAEI